MLPYAGLTVLEFLYKTVSQKRGFPVLLGMLERKGCSLCTMVSATSAELSMRLCCNDLFLGYTKAPEATCFIHLHPSQIARRVPSIKNFIGELLNDKQTLSSLTNTCLV